MENSPKSYRPIPFYFVNTDDPGRLSQAEIDRAAGRLAELHFGGLLLFNKAFSPEDYLGDFWFEMTERFILACRKYDLAMWINDGFNFPPGDAGGRILKIAPHLRQQRLDFNADGEVEAVTVGWGFPAFEYQESSNLFIKLVYEEYKKRLGKYFGCGITGIFSDADCRRVTWETEGLLKGRPYFPWCYDFAARFEAEYHYDITPYLSRILKGEKGRFSLDYWQMAGRLYQRWFANNHRWCAANNLKYAFHTSDTGPLLREECYRSSIYTEGNTLEMLAHSDCPGTDHELLRLDGGTPVDDLRRYIPRSRYGQPYAIADGRFADTRMDLRAKYASSGALLYGRKSVLCEAFAATNWSAAPADLRRIVTWQIMQGVNFFIPHAVHHVFRGWLKYFAPPEFSKTSLSCGVAELNDFIARWSCEASRGEYVAPIGVVDPTEDILSGAADGREIFELGDTLNRQGWGWRIIPRSKAGEFKWVFDPARGIAPELPPAPAVFKGSGDLHFMLRRDDNGRLRVLLANVWSDDPVEGTLTFCGREYPVRLLAGEITAVVEGSDPAPSALDGVRRIKPLRVDAELLDSQRIPLRDLRRWRQHEGIAGLRLFIPEEWAAGARLNGRELTGGEYCMIYDDGYMRYDIPTAAGDCVLDFPGGEPEAYCPVYLEGDVTARVPDHPAPDRVYDGIYNVRLLSAAESELELFPGAEIAPGGLAEQGYPFYSGRVRYRLEYGARGRALYFPEAVNAVKVFAGGREIGTAVFDGTVVNLPDDWDGSVELIQYNIPGNELEGAACANGLTAMPELLADL